MKSNKQNTAQNNGRDIGDYTKPRRFYWSRTTHSIQPFMALASEVTA